MKRTDIIKDQKFKLHGRIYLAVPATNKCWGCAFRESPADCFETPHCTSKTRPDRLDVIFIKETK